MPLLTVFAGPNGSGKSTLVARFHFAGKENLLDPDAVARRIDPADPAKAAVSAAREVISRTRGYIDQSQDFAIETTLSGSTALSTMKSAKDVGFRVRLVFICLDNPGLNIDRVGERVSRGGHHVPDPDVTRRYERSVVNLPAALRIADEAVAYDNSGLGPRKVFEARNGTIVWRSPNLPDWAGFAGA